MLRPDLRGLAAAGLVAALLAGCGGGARHSGSGAAEAALHPAPPAGSSATAPGASVTTTTPTGLTTQVPPAAPARPPALRHLQAIVLHTLVKAGPQTGAMVYDLTSHQTLFSLRGGVGRAPASVEKLYTSVALMTLLGAGTRLHTDVLGTGHLAPGGVWTGNLYLRGDGDPTFGDGAFNKIYEGGHGPTAAQLVAQLQHDGIRTVRGRIFADESRFDSDRGGPYTNNLPDLPDYGGELGALVYDHGGTSGTLSPGEFAARQLARTMRSRHMRVLASTKSVITPVGARPLATVASPPLSTLLSLMDVPSDDLFADLFAKQLGYRFAGHGTLAAGAAEISHVIEGLYGIKARIFDGSGLDKADRSTPAGIVGLLRKLWHTPVGDELQQVLPVVGETGTVQSIAQNTPAQGHCVAKTGTLDDVTNLAGYCSARGGHTLAFALFLDGPENWQAYGMLARMVAAIAAY